MQTRTLVAAVASALLIAAVAAPAAALTDPVDIYAALDLPTDSLGPRTFEVAAVVAGPGAELTAADETANPSDWCGDMLVDIDPVAQTITVSADQEVCNFETAVVHIETAEIASVAVVSDGFAVATDGNGDPLVPGATLAIQTAADGVTFTWTMIDTFDFDNGGVSVFSYELVADQPAAPATPVIVAPAFTG